MMLYKRQKLLLDLVHAAGGELAATDLQHLLFLYSRQHEAEPSFHFVPYRFGCFSFQSDADRANLELKELLFASHNNSWKLTPKAQPYLDPKRNAALTHFVTRIVPERGHDLARRVYRLHPYYAIKSEILDRVFPETEDQKIVRDARPTHSGKALFTIGYEGDCVDAYLDRLIRHGVKLLCDVRHTPLSRKTSFSKRSLSIYCAEVGIEYRHLPELGIPGHRRQDLNTLADHQALFADYCREDLPKARHAIAELAAFLKQYHRIALTCFEKDHLCCHRHCIADEMRRLLKDCPEPQHI